MNFNPIAVIVFLFITLRVFVIKAIFPVTIFPQEHLLIFDLIGQSVILNYWIALVLGLSFGLINLLFMYLVGKEIFDKKITLIATFLYSISPWTVYLEVAGSSQIFLLALLLICFFGILIMKNNPKKRFGIFLFLLSCAILLYSSLIMWLLVPMLLLVLYKYSFINYKQIKMLVIFIILISIPIELLAFKNPQGLQEVLRRDVAIFSDIGLINGVNQFQGELTKESLYSIGKYIENKYIYFSEHLLSVSLRHFVPVTYFTPEYKLLDFSFSPPILIGFLIPFLLGLLDWIKLFKKYGWSIFLTLSLMVPSIISSKSPDLSKLVIFSPFILFTISNGLVNYLFPPRNKTYRMLMILTLSLVILQALVVISDIIFREPIRAYPFIMKK